MTAQAFRTKEELAALMINLGMLEGLVRRLGCCEKEMESLAREPEFEGKRLAMIAREAVRYMHARLYLTAPLEGARGLADSDVAVALTMLCTIKLDDVLATWLAADLISEHAANVVLRVLRDQIAMRDETASTRLEVPRTLAAIAIRGSADCEMPGPTFSTKEAS